VDDLRDLIPNAIAIPATITWLTLADLILDHLLNIRGDWNSIRIVILLDILH
jgi:hypothetical protein